MSLFEYLVGRNLLVLVPLDFDELLGTILPQSDSASHVC